MAKVDPSSLIAGIHGRISRHDKTCVQTIASSGEIYTTERDFHKTAPSTESQLQCQADFKTLNTNVSHWMKTHHDHPLYLRLYKQHREQGIKSPLISYIKHLVHSGKLVLPD